MSIIFVLPISAEPNNFSMKKYYVLLTGAILSASLQTQAQTKIGGTGAPDPSAMLEVTGGTGNNKGILPPRLTTAQRNAMTLPATGLMIYNTTVNQLQVNTGTPAAPIWSIATSSNSWNTGGNTGTTPTTNFIGTTDNQSLVMRTNNAERLRIDSIGRVGIGDATPRAPLSFGSAHGPKVRLYDNNTDTLVYGFSISNASLNYIVENTDLAAHRFWSGGDNDNGTELMHIQGNGNVGIATSSPQQTLHVQGTARVTGSSGTPIAIAGRNAAGDIGNVAIGTGLSLTSGTLSATVSSPGWALGGNTGTNPATNYIGTTDAQPLLLRTNALERMRISAAGNVGIFNNNPLSPLSFASSVGPKIALYDGGSATDYFGLGISTNMLDYHVMPSGIHAFFSGGKNGDGIELMRIQSDGKVGISNSAPISPLSFANALGNKIAFYDGGSINDYLGIGVSSSQLNYHVSTNSNHVFLAGGTNGDGTELMRIAPNGNVGISNNTPLSPLSFTSTASPKISLYDGGSATDYFGLGVSTNTLNYHVMPAGVHAFYAGGKNGDGTELMRIQADGSVGIGTTAPVAKLDVNGNVRIAGSAGVPTAIMGRDASGNVSSLTLGANLSLVGGMLSATGGGAAGWALTGNTGTTPATNFIGTADAQPLVFRANNDEKIRILPNGNVGIGTATPNNHVQIAKNDYGQFGGLAISDVAGANASNFTITPGYYGSIATFGVTLDVTGEAPISFSDPIIPAADGQFSCGTSAYRWSTVYALNGTISTSDARMKKNVRNLDLGLDQVMKLRPVVYDWKDDTGKDKIGFIAQELRKVVPNVVVGDESKETLGVLYSDMIPVLTKAIQEQQAKIESQDQRINALVAENNELKESKVATAQLMERVKQMEQMMGINEIEGTSKVAGK